MTMGRLSALQSRPPPMNKFYMPVPIEGYGAQSQLSNNVNIPSNGQGEI